MKLSIVIPVYRVETTLDRCVESVVTQDYDDFEIILVDDGSPDRCPQLCDEWARRDPRISVIHKPNGGLSDARNAGIDVARGDFLTFIDSDDYIAPHTLSQVMPLTNDADLIEYPVCEFPETSSIFHHPSYILPLTSTPTPTITGSLRKPTSTPTPGTKSTAARCSPKYGFPRARCLRMPIPCPACCTSGPAS